MLASIISIIFLRIYFPRVLIHFNMIRIYCVTFRKSTLDSHKICIVIWWHSSFSVLYLESTAVFFLFTTYKSPCKLRAAGGGSGLDSNAIVDGYILRQLTDHSRNCISYLFCNHHPFQNYHWTENFIHLLSWYRE